MTTGPVVTIVMPALNEERNIQAALHNTLTTFDALGIAGEVLVINDGSTDQTGALIAAEMEKDTRIRTIRHETPQGVGASFWDGVDHAHGAFVCMLPGNAENDAREILCYFPLLEHVDIVIP